jgi:AcrR family transcriptional regulator
MARPKTRKTYHHGDLKRALLDGAITLIEEGGLDHFTMAKAARIAGGSSGAPYRHFTDRHTLLVTLAKEGAEMLDEAVDEAMGHSGLDPFEQLMALGETHVRFAIEHPAHYRVMHAPEYSDPNDVDADEATEVEANGQALTATADGHRETTLRLGAQAAIYGLARMLIDGHFPAGRDPEEATAAIRVVLRHLLRR